MPRYDFMNEETGEIREIFLPLSANGIYVDDEGKPWKKLVSAPNFSTSGKINPFSGKNFLEKTKSVKTYGEAWDISREYSDMRSEKIGASDPMREKAEKTFYKPKA